MLESPLGRRVSFAPLVECFRFRNRPSPVSGPGFDFIWQATVTESQPSYGFDLDNLGLPVLGCVIDANELEPIPARLRRQLGSPAEELMAVHQEFLSVNVIMLLVLDICQTPEHQYRQTGKQPIRILCRLLSDKGGFLLCPTSSLLPETDHLLASVPYSRFSD